MHKLYLYKGYFFNCIMDCVNDDPKRLYLENCIQQSRKGEVFKAIVQDVFIDKRSAFVDIGIQSPVFMNLTEKDLDIKKGQTIIVQVQRECQKDKPYRVSQKIAIEGKHIILTPYENTVRFSKRIDKEVKKEMKTFFETSKEYTTIYDETNFGMIVRKVTDKVCMNDIIDEYRQLSIKWKEAIQHLDIKVAPCLIYKKPSLDKIMLNNFTINNDTMIISNMPIEKPQVRQFNMMEKDDLSIFLSIISNQLNRYHMTKEQMEIVVDYCEAGTMIDINSKGAIRSDVLKNQYKINVEASKATCQMIEARNIAGIILIDFLQMSSFQKEKFLSGVRKEFKKDYAKTKVLGFTETGLLELSREKVGLSVYDVFYNPVKDHFDQGMITMESLIQEIKEHLKAKTSKGISISLSYDLYGFYLYYKTYIDRIFELENISFQLSDEKTLKQFWQSHIKMKKNHVIEDNFYQYKIENKKQR